jgi:thiazole synthase
MVAMNAPVETAALDDPLVIAGHAYRSRLLVGTGKYRDFAQTREAVAASGAQIVTVAIRRTNIGQDAGAPSLIDALPPSEFTYLPNSAGCYTADDAVRTLKLARELLDGHALTKLEVLGDKETLYPNVRETLKAAETLVADGFQVMVYTSDDPIAARELEAIGCVAIMPLASLIGSGLGILNPWNLRLIIDQRRCRCWSTRVGIARRGRRDGAGMFWRADEHGDCAGSKTRAHGARDELAVAGWARRVSRRPHAEKAYAGSPSSPTSGLIS